ncbi:ADP-ribosylation factor-like protein 9 [Octodon degus]|uniref:ADP-ribosylation factor-like protein 9 n=1 Tax=Octodon degus TaxID=10160 RepID=A0A6P6E3C4_OCTDE|nr:ADP-ribosylation factor-like protein 9 [Octodon degus]
MERRKGKTERTKVAERDSIRGTGKEEKRKGVGEKIQGKEKGKMQVNGTEGKRTDNEEEKRKEQNKETEKEKEQVEEKREEQHAGTWTSRPPLPSEESKQILVLGLDGAGKTSVLHTLASNRVLSSVAPTQGFNAVNIDAGGGLMEFLEIGGSEPSRSSWEMHLSKGLLLIFVVDSADHHRLPEAKKYLHQLVEANPIIPLVVFAHKQDLEAAYDITDIHEALALSEVGNDRQLFLFGTQVTEKEISAEVPSTIEDAKHLIAYLAAGRP